ncbi:sulfite exporter TauE/SafE family protein [Actinomadura logoneensis]|uniref:Probable membrane transporter protein n=1 Tax=Actinomadura logoneensis TaxID=2293572 RepID=A0A372JI17_9ACTN|nr:sulfite exporter TauE/SafE family protein [Actinomadura logoneensis]RFU39549.1 sulfite exporter TauE/SafE family protein [Actinomadura logoneensis]
MTTLILALGCGAAAGLVLGALGAGGSMLTVPALVYLLGFTPADATTASLVIVAVTSLTALYTHARAGNVRWKAGTLFAVAGIVPAAVAGLAAGHLPQPVLTAVFALVAGFAAVRMIRATTAAKPADETAGDTAPAPDGTETAEDGTATAPDEAVASPGKAAATGAGLGALTGLLGVGGGFLAVPALVDRLAFPMRAAIGTSLLVIAVNALASLVMRGAAASALDWATIVPFTAAAILAARDGRRVAGRLSGRLLQRGFAVTLLAVAALMLVDALT